MTKEEREKTINNLRKTIERLRRDLKMNIKVEKDRDWLSVALFSGFIPLKCSCGIKVTYNYKMSPNICPECESRLEVIRKEQIESNQYDFNDLHIWKYPDYGPTKEELSDIITQVVLESLLVP